MGGGGAVATTTSSSPVAAAADTAAASSMFAQMTVKDEKKDMTPQAADDASEGLESLAAWLSPKHRPLS